jgi:hypothetical protein
VFGWETSGIVNASEYFGANTWIFTVQAHDKTVPSLSLGEDNGQLLFLELYRKEPELLHTARPVPVRDRPRCVGASAPGRRDRVRLGRCRWSVRRSGVGSEALPDARQIAEAHQPSVVFVP